MGAAGTCLPTDDDGSIHHEVEVEDLDAEAVGELFKLDALLGHLCRVTYGINDVPSHTFTRNPWLLNPA